ncbi:hypothetical protein Avi_3401 [Allorhizobium ampelinum S4]|uniref:Uncharacterized protein n=1 Tax=Allorhizobium ampelinum (strain ATCC BAA-846 / DSM 112012 / S4) TaxID=311402 RepID=B9JZX5_ALLAM|nr:hypothetical protein Avi_3401 [Allorhizobium ampelinum S4]
MSVARRDLLDKSATASGHENLNLSGRPCRRPVCLYRPGSSTNDPSGEIGKAEYFKSLPSKLVRFDGALNASQPHFLFGNLRERNTGLKLAVPDHPHHHRCLVARRGHTHGRIGLLGLFGEVSRIIGLLLFHSLPFRLAALGDPVRARLTSSD